MSEMTNEQLDAEIAEKVLGLTRCDGTENHEASTCYVVDSDGSCWYHAGLVPINPSSDWSAAAMVVERMRSMKYWLYLEDLVNKWRASFCGPDWPPIWDWRRNVVDGSATRAICLAALTALAAERGGK